MAANHEVGVPHGMTEISRLSLDDDNETMNSAPPELNTPGVVAIDITDKFSRASKALPPGEVVKDGFFTLFEPVGALEIMDPKMDSGCVKPGDEFEELYDVTIPLTPEDVLGIIDQLLCHEMSWHLGYPLSQTLFTCVYVEALLMPDPQGIDQAQFVRDGNYPVHEDPLLEVLRAYCLGMLKACGYVNERVRSEHFYEEEDFVTNTYNRTLLDNVSTYSIRHVIADSIAFLESRDFLKPIDFPESALKHPRREVADALISRLKLRDIILSAVECSQHVDNLDLARKPWDEGLTLLPTIKSTHALADSCDSAFSAKLQRKLASTIPPRPIVQLGFDDAFRHLSRMFQDGQEVVKILDTTNSQCLLNFVFFFQAKRPQPLVYIRTLLQTFLFDAMEMLGNMSVRQILNDDLSIVTLPASLFLDDNNDSFEATHDPRFLIARQMELFRQRAAQPFLDILRIFCQNRPRVRRMLCHTIRAWDNLHADAEELDQILQTKAQELLDRGHTSSLYMISVHSNAWPLSVWTYLYKLRQMEWIVQLGFELEVYQPDELGGMYWYLSYLSKQRLEYSPLIKALVAKAAEEIRAQPGTGEFVRVQVYRCLSFFRVSLLDAAVTSELSVALSCIYTVLGRLGLVKTPQRPYSDDKLRYELRMKPFVPIGVPELPSFETFTTQVTQPESSTEAILAAASTALTQAKEDFERLSKLSAEHSFAAESYEQWMASVKNGLKSCIAMGLVVTTLQNAMGRTKEGGEMKLRAEVPTPDKAYHEWWIVPKLVPIP